MIKLKYLVLLSAFALAGIHLSAQNTDFKYQPDWESIRSHYKVPDWFRDAKFGIFLHWGPYAVQGINCKYPKGIYQESWKKDWGENSPWNYHRKHYGDPSKVGYKDVFPEFKAEKFDAKHWVELFKKAGAKYVVPVAEHHDGFAMYNSNVTRWNVVKTGPKRDVMRELKTEVEKAGLKFGMSSHFALNRQYYSHADPTWDTNNPAYYDLYWKPVEKGSLPSKEFLNLWWRRTTDIIDQYQPDLLWFDFGLDKPGFEPVHKKILAYYYNKGLAWNKEVVFQDKNMNKVTRVNGKVIHDRSVKSFPEDIIVLDLERGRMDSVFRYPWQTDTSVGKIDWGYNKNEEYKSPYYLIDELIDIVSKNGCLLLNIGPKANGTLPDEAVDILVKMGDWLSLNGEAIYETRPWKIFGEGPTKVSSGNHSEGENKENVAEDIRFTQKKGVLYATSLGWPKNGSFTIKSLAKGNQYESRKIASVEFISGSNKINWKQNNNGLEIKTKGQKPCEAAYVFKIEFE